MKTPYQIQKLKECPPSFFVLFEVFLIAWLTVSLWCVSLGFWFLVGFS